MPAAAMGLPEGEEVMLPPGSHLYPFEVALPRSLPGSLEGKWGNIRYQMEAVLVRKLLNITATRGFEVMSYSDLNEDIHLGVSGQATGDHNTINISLNDANKSENCSTRKIT